MKAICIDNKTEEHKNYKGVPVKGKIKGLTKDKEYEVKQSKEYDNYFEVVNDLGEIETYKKIRFEAIKKVVRCIKSGNASYLNIGEEYIVEEEEEKFYIIKINGIGRMFDKSRFEIVEDKKVEEAIKVKCIDTDIFKTITKGKEYILKSEIEDNYLIIDDKGSCSFYPKDLFDDVLTVECIDNKIATLELTKGKLYEVIEQTERRYKIKNDRNKIDIYFKERFKPVELQKEENKKVCYRFDCANNDTTGLCMNNILCSDAIKEPPVLNYEEENKKLKTENENIKYELDAERKANEYLENECKEYKEANVELGDLRKKLIEETEILKNKINHKEVYWQNYIMEIKAEYDNLIIRLENTVKSLEKELEEHKKANETIPVLQTKIDKLRHEIEMSNHEKSELFIKIAAYESREKMINALKIFIECM